MAIEDFTTYTEVDANNKLTVTASKADGVRVDRDEDVYLYKDKTVDYFDALNIDFEIYIASTSQYVSYGAMAVANTIGTLPDLADSDIDVWLRKTDADNYLLALQGGTGADGDWYACNPDTLYYCTLERVAGSDTVTLKIYSDAARTNLLDTLSIAGRGTTKWRYIYGFINWYSATPHRNWDGYVQNLDLEPVLQKFSSDTGSGVDAKVSYPSVILVKSDLGQAIEASLFSHKDLFRGDSGLGIDSQVALAPQSEGDVGVGVDAKVSYPTATLIGAETGSGVEAVIGRAIWLPETGSGVDASALLAEFTKSDLGSGVDASALLAEFLKSDVGSGIDILTVKGMIQADSGSGADARVWYESSPFYEIHISWDNTGNFDGAYDNITADVTEISFERGKDEELGRAVVGSLELTLNNADGKYSPENEISPLYGSLLPKRPIRLRVIWNSELVQFYGFLERIIPHPVLTEQDAYIYCLDGLDYLARAELSTVLYKNQLTGYLAGKILDAADWPAAKRVIDSGQDTVPYGYWKGVKARYALNELEDSEIGFIYINYEGKFCWEDRQHRQTAPHTTSQHTFDNTMVDITYELNAKSIYNEIKVTVTPWELQAESEIWRLEEEPTIADGVSKTWWADFEDFADSIVDPIATTDYQAWTGAGGTGTDKTANITVVLTPFAKGAKLVVTNNAGVAVYLYLLKLRGELYDSRTKVTRKAEDATSQTKYQKRTLALDGKFMADAEAAQDYCDYALLKYKEPQGEVSIDLVNSNDTLREQILKRKVSDRITVVNTLLGLDADFFINKVTHQISEGGLLHKCTWVLSAVGTEYMWVPPTGGSGDGWSNIPNAYDGDTGSYASGVIV